MSSNITNILIMYCFEQNIFLVAVRYIEPRTKYYRKTYLSLNTSLNF